MNNANQTSDDMNLQKLEVRRRAQEAIWRDFGQGDEFYTAVDRMLLETLEQVLNDIPMSQDIRSTLLPPHVNVTTGRTFDTNGIFVRLGSKAAAIIFNLGLIQHLVIYTRAASTYFLPVESEGKRPSPYWRSALRGASGALDFVCSPLALPFSKQFHFTRHQGEQAAKVGTAAIRFVLCHELAHVIAFFSRGAFGSIPSTRWANGESVNNLEWSTKSEFAADFGGAAQLVWSKEGKAAFDELAGVLYYLHSVCLIEEFSSRPESSTHPPARARLDAIIENSSILLGPTGPLALAKLDDELTELDFRILRAARRQCEAAERDLEGCLRVAASFRDVPRSGPDFMVALAIEKHFFDEATRLLTVSPSAVAKVVSSHTRSLLESSQATGFFEPPAIISRWMGTLDAVHQSLFVDSPWWQGRTNSCL